MMLARFAFITRAYRALVGPFVTRSMIPTRSFFTSAKPNRSGLRPPGAVEGGRPGTPMQTHPLTGFQPVPYVFGGSRKVRTPSRGNARARLARKEFRSG